MELKDIYKIKETSNIDVANKLIEQNWVLIDKYTNAPNPMDAPNSLILYYVFGITKENYENYDDTEIKKLENPYSGIDYGW